MCISDSGRFCWEACDNAQVHLWPAASRLVSGVSWLFREPDQNHRQIVSFTTPLD